MYYDPSKRSQKQIIRTNDGSTTLYSCEFDQTYHSTKDGALNESLQKHVIPALTLQRGKPHLNILDINYGLGYNTLATLHYIQAHDLDVTVHIISPEFDEPLVRSLWDFDYPPDFDGLRPVIEAISEGLHYEDDRFVIDVVIGDARETILSLCRGEGTTEGSTRGAPTYAFDVVYQDAFSPEANPLLWTREWFSDVRRLCAENAVLTSYSIAAAIRMGLHENGFMIYDYRPTGTRSSLIASVSPIMDGRMEGLTWIDMALKMERNPEAQSLRDGDFMD